MADDAAALEALKATLEAARYAPEKAFSAGDKRIEMKADSEMRQALADLDQRINRAKGGRGFGIVRVIPDKGV